MRIFLINPLINKEIPPFHFPLGLGYIASVLRDKGYEVEILDIDALRLEASQVLDIISELQYDVVGISGFVTNYSYIKWLSQQLKKRKPDKLIVLGGALASTSFDIVIRNTDVDVCVLGEGEATILELIEALKRKLSFQEIKGIVYKNKNGICRNIDRPRIKSLSEIPFPAWEIFPLDIYMTNHPKWIKSNKDIKRSFGLVTSRGCPYSCNYCSKVFGKIFVSRDVGSIVNEIMILFFDYQVDYIIFYDELFTYNKKIFHLCDEIIKKKIKLKWSCFARVDSINIDMLKKMKQAGCDCVVFGIESGSQTILNYMNKQCTIEDAEKAIKMCRDIGLEVDCSFMFGYPGETINTIKETLSFCEKMKLCPEIFFTTPLPGTVLYEETKERGLIKDEEAYIRKINDLTSMTLNLTELSDKEFFKAAQLFKS